MGQTSRDAITLNAVGEEGGERGDTIPCPTSQDDYLRVEMVSWIGSLPPLERDVLIGLYVRDITEAEFARRLGTTQQQISRLKQRALCALRQGGIHA